jgi:hypothetical protein
MAHKDSFFRIQTYNSKYNADKGANGSDNERPVSAGTIILGRSAIIFSHGFLTVIPKRFFPYTIEPG